MNSTDNKPSNEPSTGFGFIILMIVAVIVILGGIKFALG